ncbi:HD domain-containing protein [Arthrobacter castelli]|uniref:HD domain-containing protein n=1 Tax=Arthrobacter castelli TaxID=271431 RepID=UPI0004084B40|nr:HD domain-containing protein [Arthrobacter castelli]
MSTLPTVFPRVPLKCMDPSMLVFELDRESHRLIPDSCEMITSAATMASFLHREQTRAVRGDMPKVPYIEHPLRVALRLIRWGARDGNLIAAALLHDVAEDCAAELVDIFGHGDETVFDCLGRLYGGDVAECVKTVTNPTDGTGYEEHLCRLADSQSPALLIKASDLKDNAGSIRHQLGHGKDSRMLCRLRKYLPVVDIVSTELMNSGGGAMPGAVTATAAIKMTDLSMDLLQLADEHNIVI